MGNEKSRPDIQEIRHLMSASELDILQKIGKELHSETAMGMSDVDLIAIARKWMSKNAEYLQNAICKNQTILNFVHDHQQKEDVELSIAVFGVLMETYPELCSSMASMLISVLVVRRGIKSFCSL